MKDGDSSCLWDWMRQVGTHTRPPEPIFPDSTAPPKDAPLWHGDFVARRSHILRLPSDDDDAIVVVMADAAEDGLSPREREYRASMQRLRKTLAKSPRGYDLSDDAPPQDRIRYWQLKEIAGRLTVQVARSRVQRARAELGQDAGSSIYRIQTGSKSVARETGPRDETLSAYGAPRLAAVERELASMLERTATRAELESVRDDVRLVAEGYAAVEPKLDAVNQRLNSLLSRISRLELQVLRLEGEDDGA